MKRFLRTDFLILLLIVFFTFLITIPFFSKGYFVTDDGEWAIIRLASMIRVLRSGQFPARWSSYLNHGFGYPLFNFVYPLPYYLGAPLAFLGLGLVNTIKLGFVLSVLFSGLGIYLLVKDYLGKMAGVLAAGFYLLAPFRLVNLYVRGSLGECLAMALYPWILLSVKRFGDKQKPKRLVILSFLIAALILTHNVSALFFMPAVFLFLIIQKCSLKHILAIFGLGIGLSAFFLLPALLEQKQVMLSQMPLANKEDHFVSLQGLLFSPWGYGGPLSDNPFSFQIGWPALILATLGFVLSVVSQKKNKLLITNYSLLITSVFLMLPMSKAFWGLPLFNKVDFPWRLLGPASFFLSLSVVGLFKKKLMRLLITLTLLLTAFLYLPKARSLQKVIKSDDCYRSNDATTTSMDELMPIWVKQKPLERPQEPVRFDFEVDLKETKTLTINQHYYPGWRAWIDGQTVEVLPEGERGLVGFSVPQGNHWVKIRLKSTAIQRLGNLISLGALLISLLILFKGRYLCLKRKD